MDNLADRLARLEDDEVKAVLGTYELVNKKSAMQLLRIYELRRQQNTQEKHTTNKRSTK